MNHLKLSNEQLTALVQSGFAPQFLSLAEMMRTAVRTGAQMLYDALTNGMEDSRASSIAEVLQQANVSDEVLFSKVNEEISLDSLRSVLQQVAELGARRMYELLPQKDQELVRHLVGNAFAPQIDPLHVEGEPGMLSYDEIVEVITCSTVVAFNYDSYPTVDMDGGWIRVRRPGKPDYLFSEDAAASAVYDGKRLSMPDVQGFPCTFVLE